MILRYETKKNENALVTFKVRLIKYLFLNEVIHLEDRINPCNSCQDGWTKQTD